MSLRKSLPAQSFLWLALLIAYSAWGLVVGASIQSSPAYYGSGFQFDVLDNQRVSEIDVDYRFRATHSGTVKGFIWYDVYVKGGATAGCSGAQCECDGYGCGTGGTLTVCIYSDDGTPSHFAADPQTQRSTSLQTHPLACVSPHNLRSGAALRTEVFPAPPFLTAGTLYHLHWHNSDPNPTRNFLSVDDTCVWHATKPRQPTIPDTDLAVLVGTKLIETDTPIFQLNYSDGTTQGQGYKESWNYLSEKISGLAKIGEWFRVSESDRTVTSVSVRLNRISGADPLVVTLVDGDGSIIDQGTIPASSFSTGDALTGDTWASRSVRPDWGTFTFSKPHTLKVGRSYQLILSAPSNTVYQGYAIQRASGYKFTSPTFFGDGYGEFSRDDGLTWTGFRQSEDSFNHKDADIQFYFASK